MDTIFALATAPGKSGVAIIRLSGPRSHEAVRQLCGDLPAVRQASVRKLLHPDGTLLDEALVLVFDTGQSFTGEQSAELQLHGSMAIISAVMDVLSQMDGLRLADPGEFTRRAMENGQMDLAQVEGLADLIEAETEGQRRQALRVFSGALGDKADGWRRKLIRAAALLEATIDFADEDVPTDVSPEVLASIDVVSSQLQAEISGVSIAERIRDGFEVAIVGAPNVGKSTLLNTLAGRDAAITSEVAGTTRDVIEVRMDLGGMAVTLLDTAGIRETDDHVEMIGIARARERAEQADIRVFLLDEGETPELESEADDLVFRAKADLHEGLSGGISGKTGEGVSDLVDAISERIAKRSAGAGVAMRVRHKHAMVSGVSALAEARRWVSRGADHSEIAAEELRSAVRALDSLVGRVDVESVLDEIFASFCLGK